MRSYIVLAVLVCAAAIFEEGNADCDINACMKDVQSLLNKPVDELTKSDCGKVNEAVKCGYDTIINNSKCDQDAKNQVMYLYQQYSQAIAKCKAMGGGVAALVASLFLCLAMNGVAYFMKSFK